MCSDQEPEGNPRVPRSKLSPEPGQLGRRRFLGSRAQAVFCPQVLPRDSSSWVSAARARARPGRASVTGARESPAHFRLEGHPPLAELTVAWWCRLVRWPRRSAPGPTPNRAPTWGSRRLFTCVTSRRAAPLLPSYFNPGTAPAPPRICVASAGPVTPAQRGWACRRSSSRGRAGLRVQAGRGRRGRGRAMLGKDYMLAIILVNCDDDLWGDQSLEGEPGLPPGWRKIHDAAGTYYWHVPSGSTQWQRPTWEPGDAEEPGTRPEGIWGLRPPKGRSFSSLESSLDRSNSLSWYGEESYIQSMEPGAKCFAVRSLGWVEVPEEDLVPGKSSIAVSNCIQQLAQTRSRSQPPAGAWGEGQNMLMILKKDAMSLVNPLDHSLIHCQPLVHIRVWGVGSSKGRDFAFVAGDKDSCMLKCHVFRCDVPAKAIASALHGLCAQILSERVGVSGDSPCCSLDTISPEDLPRQAELLDAVSQAAQKYQALYMGTLPVTKAMGMDVLNEAIGILTTRGDRDAWVPAMLSVSDSFMTAHPIQAEADAEEEPLWQCPVRLVTFIGVGRDPHTFGLIADLGRQSFQCAAFWCQPHAGGLSEAVQAACMVQYQKCLVASASRGKAWGAQARARLRLKRTSSVDSPGGPLPLPLLKGGVGGAGAAPRKRGIFSFLDAFRLKPSLLHMS